MGKHMTHNMLSLADIAVRTGLPLRTVRYCIDHSVLPLAEPSTVGRGKVREYLPQEGFAIATAALLLDAGVKRNLVTACIFESISKYGREYRIENIPLHQAFQAQQASLRIADGLYVRIDGTAKPGIQKSFDTGWMPLNQRVPKPDATYAPIVITTVDLTALRKSLGL